VGAEYSTAQWQHFAEQFIRQGLLAQDMGHGGLSLTDRGRVALKGAPVYVAAQPRPSITAPVETPYEAALFEKLRQLRRQLADAADVPPFMIFSDRTLTELATYLPHTPSTLGAIHGIGERKAAQYGAAVLEAIRAYCTEHGLTERPRPAGGAPVADRPKRRWEEVGELFAAGHSIPEIAELFAVKLGTVAAHLGAWQAAGRPIDAGRVREISTLSAEDQARVLAKMAELGPERLSPIFEALDGAIPYDELHLLRICYHAGDRAGESFSSARK
jgi:ATP-dependent DNA helicase RecQ